MQDNTSWTPSADDNKLGLTDKAEINECEAKGIAEAELFVFGLNIDSEISAQLIREIHRLAFAQIYDWGGQWRTINVAVGQLLPPDPAQIIQLIYQFTDNLNFKIKSLRGSENDIETLVFTHYEFIRIHPFNNGNGRTGRILMNLVALKFGYKPLELYHREGDNRMIYINAMRSADNGDFEPLTHLVRKELVTF